MESDGDKQKSTKKFSVVHFIEENLFSVVPSTWLSSDRTFCSWPTKKTKNSATLQEDPTSVPDKNWTAHTIRFVKGFGSFNRAFEKSEALKNSAALEISESSATEEDGSNHRKNVRTHDKVYTAPEQGLHQLDITAAQLNFGSADGSVDINVSETDLENLNDVSQDIQNITVPEVTATGNYNTGTFTQV